MATSSWEELCASGPRAGSAAPADGRMAGLGPAAAAGGACTWHMPDSWARLVGKVCWQVAEPGARIWLGVSTGAQLPYACVSPRGCGAADGAPGVVGARLRWLLF